MSILFAEIQTKFLSGSGCVIGDTSVTISNLVDILGNNITMASYFGTMGWATHEQGTPNERQITFTGITVNGNGTSTLTGVNTNRMYSSFDVVATGEDIDLKVKVAETLVKNINNLVSQKLNEVKKPSFYSFINFTYCFRKYY